MNCDRDLLDGWRCDRNKGGGLSINRGGFPFDASPSFWLKIMKDGGSYKMFIWLADEI